MNIPVPVIVDSSALISLASTTDQNNALATQVSNILQESNRPIILPGEIITEVINVLGKKETHSKAFSVGKELINSSEYIITETTPKIRQLSLKKFEAQPGSVSFTDCLVMAFADEFETKEIFGFDETFKKNGYVRVGIDND